MQGNTPYEQNGFLLQRVAHDVVQMQRSFVATLELTVPQAKTLVYLYTRIGIDTFQNDVEHFFNLKASTVNGILVNLEKKGFVMRSVMPDDKRYRKIVLTDKGYSVSDALNDSIHQIENKLIQNMSDDEQIQFRQLLFKALENMEK